MSPRLLRADASYPKRVLFLTGKKGSNLSSLQRLDFFVNISILHTLIHNPLRKSGFSKSYFNITDPPERGSKSITYCLFNFPSMREALYSSILIYKLIDCENFHLHVQLSIFSIAIPLPLSFHAWLAALMTCSSSWTSTQIVGLMFSPYLTSRLTFFIPSGIILHLCDCNWSPGSPSNPGVMDTSTLGS